jgi:hypothetical protein
MSLCAHVHPGSVVIAGCPREGGLTVQVSGFRVVTTSVAVLVMSLVAPIPGSAAGSCAKPAPPHTPSGPSADAETVQPGSEGDPEIKMVRYPRPDRPPGGSNPWSQWGQGLVLRDGRFLSGIGDHRGRDGESYLFVYDPQRGRLTRFADVGAVTDRRQGDWGFGKIHGQIVAGPCGKAYFATYWGTREDIVYNDRYQGDELFEIDTATLTIESLGSPVETHGIPSLAGLGDGFVYGEAVDPFAEGSRGHEEGAFFVYDVRKRRVAFRSDEREHSLFRNVMLDGRGHAYVAGEEGRLLVYEPGSSSLKDAGIELPGGGALRASTRPAPDGTIYGVTQGYDEDPDVLFALDPDGSVRRLGEARGYTASLALSADGSHFYYVPGAHGDSFAQGTPVISVDGTTGDQEVVARLNDLAEERIGLTLGGTYNVALDRRRDVLYVGLNAGTDRERPWGEIVLAVIELGQ